jgi:hypothetical protein
VQFSNRSHGLRIDRVSFAKRIEKFADYLWSGFDDRIIRHRLTLAKGDGVEPAVTISFPEDYNFNDRSIKLLQGTIGIYFIYLVDLRIPYPFGQSRLIYIGMSESKQNSIGRRLLTHFTGQSGNHGIKNYADRYKAKFTYHSYQLLRDLGATDLLEIESFFLGDFLRAKGSFPICNNQSGVVVIESLIKQEKVSVDWEHFS